MTSPISCPDLNRLKDMLAGTLPEQEQSTLTGHLDTCPACRQTLEDLATEGESWSVMVRNLKSAPATVEPALDEAIKEIKASATEVGVTASVVPPTDSAEFGLEFLSPADQPGQLGRLGHYAITAVVGRGGMGVVLKAFDSTLHRVVAIKVLAPQLATSPGARKRFLREARAAAAVSHDHVVTIHAVDEANGMPYLVMQYIAGVSLQDRLDRDGPLPVKEILRIGMQTASGLAAAHAHGLIHRDIKPSNILLENGVERAKITDFGLARAADDAGLTQSGAVAGTPQFMAPEQARGEALDHRADLFSLGSVLYMMCTGRPPFRADSALAVLRRVSEDTPRPIQDINADIPPWLTDVIAKLHAKDPVRRYQSAAEVAETLRRHLHQLQGIQAEPLPLEKRVPPPQTETVIQRKPRRMTRRLAWLGGATAIFLAVATGVPVSMYQNASRQVENLPKRLQAFPQEMATQLKNLVETERGKRMHLAVTGPGTFQAGAPNEYRIVTKNLNNQPIPARLTVRIRDEPNKAQPILFETKDIESNGEYRFVSPTSVSVKAKGELLLEVSAVGAKQEARLSEKMSLLAPAYVTHLTTDRPMYRPGEVVGFRSLTLDSFRREPAAEDLRLIFTVTNPNGQEVHKIEGPALLVSRPGADKSLLGPDGQPIRGIGAGEYPIPADAPGGEYILSVRDALDRFAPQRRSFVVQDYEKPRLKKELEFTRKSYGPGEEVVAGGHVSRIEGGLPLADQPVTATILVDGKRYRADGKEDAHAQIPLRTDGSGTVTVRFLLPAQIDKGAASLSLRFTDGGNVETVVRPIPVVLKKLRVEFFPEGGDLVAGVPNRVYFQARTALDHPADLKGRIVDDDKGKVVAEVQTLSDDKRAGANQGLGSFELTPAAGAAYELKIDAPAGIEGKYSLPPVKTEGVVLHIEDQPRRTDFQSVLVRSAGRDRELLVGVFYHGRLLAHESKSCKAGHATRFELHPGGPGGVYRVTVFEEREVAGGQTDMVPVAERLVYRQPPHRLQLKLTSDKEVYMPRDTVKVACWASDESGQRKPAILLVGVVDRGGLALADEKTVRSMPTHFLLTSEVRRVEDLEHADFLVGDTPQAARAMDLLLGTQGWRRFAEKDPGQFRQTEPNESKRLLAALGQMPVKTSNALEVEEAFAPEISEKLRVKTAELNQAQQQIKADLAQAQDSVALYQRAGRVLAMLGLGLVALSIVAGFLIVTFVLFKKAGPVAGASVGVLGVVCLVLASLLVIGTVSRMGEQMQNAARKTAEGMAFKADKAVDVEKSPPRFKRPFGGPHDAAFDFESPEAGPLYRDNRYDLAINVNNKRAELFQGKRPPLPDGREFRRPRPEQTASLPALVAREYAHRKANVTSQVRSDFTETVYWHPALVLSDGTEFLDFDLSDAVTSYEIRALGHTLDGRLGEFTATIAARKPFSVEPKIPVEISHNDKVDLPVTIANDTNERRDADVYLQVKNLELTADKVQQGLQLDANQRKRLVYRLQPAVIEGAAGVYVSGKCAPFAADRIVRHIKVVPDGFPITVAHSDVLDQIVRHELVLPKTWIKGTLKVAVRVYPSILADLETGLDAMLQEPHGCFEQASSSNYPNLLILDYLRENRQANPHLTRRAEGLLADGYRKLVAFECQNPRKKVREGYEWFGGDAPPHEALTAYGLLEFRDMSRVFDVDKAMVERTRAYLLGQRDGQGGFKRNSRALDQFGRAPDNITNAYIVWALTERGKDDDLSKELSALTQQAKKARDPYFLALVATSLLNRGQKAEAAPLLKALADAQDRDGFVAGAQTSIVASRGRDLQIETTSLAILAWTRANPPRRFEQFRANLQAAGKWLVRQRGGPGGFGASQANVLALKALTSLSQAAKTKAGELILHVADRDLARRKIPANALEVLTLELPDADKVLHPGTNKLRIESVGGNEFPYTLTWSYRTKTPPSSAKCPVALTTQLDRARAQEGDTLRLSATIENKEDQGQGMAVAIIGLPGGLTLPEDMKQLKELTGPKNGGTEPGSISFWEIRGRELILYWRQLAPKEKIAVNLDLICRVPGEYRGPASRTYLYYGADDKCWVEPLAVAITPKAGE
jgi:serine/threonine protein kinase